MVVKTSRPVPPGALWIGLIGLAGATAVFFTAKPAPANPLGYDPQDTKMYLLRMEQIGGRANVFATEIQQGFIALWHGRTLAFTIAFLSLAAAAAFWFIATHPFPSEAEAEQIARTLGVRRGRPDPRGPTAKSDPP
jgi:hypothetical protein